VGWARDGAAYSLSLATGVDARLQLDAQSPRLQLLTTTHTLLALADGAAYPSAPIAVRRGPTWTTPAGVPRIQIRSGSLAVDWSDGVGE